MESPVCSNLCPLLLVLALGIAENSLAHLHPLLHLSWSPRLPSTFTSSVSPFSFVSMRSSRGPLLFVRMLSLMLSRISGQPGLLIPCCVAPPVDASVLKSPMETETCEHGSASSWASCWLLPGQVCYSWCPSIVTHTGLIFGLCPSLSISGQSSILFSYSLK